MSPYEAIGLNGGLTHIFQALSIALDNVDYEAMSYGVKLISNLASNSEIAFVMSEAGYIDNLCRIMTCLRDGPKQG